MIPNWATQAVAAASRAASSGTSSRSTGSTVRRTTGSAAPAKAAPSLDTNRMAEEYGMTTGFINAYPEIKSLFQQAVREGWTADTFQAKLKNTNWYKSMSDAQRKAATMRYSDPATWSALWTKTNAHVRDMMAEAGANPDDWSQVDRIASKIIWEGWNDDQARDMVGQLIVFGPNGMAGGKAGEIQTQLNQYAYSMGVKNSDDWIQSATRQVATGKASLQQFKNDLMNTAIATFPGYADQLKAGMTMSDIAQPYTQSMAQILELPPGQVNLFDPTIRGALSFKDSAGKATAKPLWQFQNDLRSDPRWTKTQNAQDATMGVAHKVLQDFGVYS